MGRAVFLLVLLMVLAAAAGAVYLGSRELPPPTARVEKIIPNDRFPR